jgi:hypothetical protein
MIDNGHELLPVIHIDELNVDDNLVAKLHPTRLYLA